MFETRFNKSNTIIKNLLLIKGLGKFKIFIICKALGINPQLRLKDLSKNHSDRLYTLLSKIKKQTHLDYVIQDIDNTFMSLPTNNYSLIREQLGTKKRYEETIDTLIYLINKNATHRYFNVYNLNFNQFTTSNLLSSYGFSKKGYGDLKESITNTKLEKNNILDNNIIIDENLKDYEKNIILNLISTNTYRGRRLKLGYPTRGQRTRTNARTARKLNRRS